MSVHPVTTAADTTLEVNRMADEILSYGAYTASLMLRTLAAERDELRSALTDAQEVARRGDEIILRLDQKLAAAHSSLTAAQNDIAACAAQCDKYRASLTARDKDAARYQWLREQMHIAGAAIVEVLQPAGDWGNSVTAESPEGLDAAIDAAMEKANG